MLLVSHLWHTSLCHTCHTSHCHVSLVIKCFIGSFLVTNFNKVRGEVKKGFKGLRLTALLSAKAKTILVFGMSLCSQTLASYFLLLSSSFSIPIFSTICLMTRSSCRAEFWRFFSRAYVGIDTDIPECEEE
jgi:hypothetical protein